MSFGSSNIPNILIAPGVNSVTGSTGATGPTGITGYSLTGPTGSDGIQFLSTKIVGTTLGITYENNTGFFLTTTSPAGSSSRDPNPNFIVGETGSSEDFSIYGGITADPYKFIFKSIKLTGEVTGGISLSSFYISSPGTTNAAIGSTGSLMYITVGANFGRDVDGTNDAITKYSRSIITPTAGSFNGITLDTFSFKITQHFDTEFRTGYTGNINWINATNANVSNVLNAITVKSSLVSGGSGITRTDQAVFITVKDEDNNIYPKVSFRTEGITLHRAPHAVTGAFEMNIIGKGITYSTETYKNQIIGSCCYCSTGNSSIVNRKCLDYSTESFCDSIGGNFNFKSCNNRYLSDDCYSGGACCANGTCFETDDILCEKARGSFYPNVRCSELENGCPSSCPVTASCCVNGECYELSASPASIDLCKELGGRYEAGLTCGERNCCVEGFIGACCFGVDDCKDDTTPAECKALGGVYQGPTSLCSSSICCKDSDTEPTFRSISITTDNTEEIPTDLKIGDSFGGGIVAGFVGYPPAAFDNDGYFAKGEIISEIENNTINSVKRYVAVNGTYNGSLRCNCSNFSPSRYVTLNELGKSNGRVLVTDVKSLSGVRDYLDLTFYNRLSDTCLSTENKPCNEKSAEYKKYGYNSILAYKQLSKQIHGDNIPNAWVLIVAPEDFNTTNVSFGMSMSVNAFTVSSEMSNYSNTLWQNNISTPYGTTVFDGLLNTRMFDETSIERNTWFIPNNYTVAGKLETIDPLAYDRFKHSRVSYWQSDIDQTKISRSSDYFKSKYKEMWNAINTSSTALYHISEKNKQSYNGYSDWYIPSALELNIVYYNIDSINTGIIYHSTGSSVKLSTDSLYWSSTTGGKMVDSRAVGTNGASVKTYQQQNYSLEAPISSSDVLTDSWKSYKLAQAHRAYTQDFGTGKMISSLKTEQVAKVRACRMVPIYFKAKDQQNQFEFSFKSLNTCTSCRQENN
jgi:hypothetical protein